MEPEEVTTPNLPNASKLREHCMRMFTMLGVQFIAGVGLATIADVNPDAKEQSLLHNIFLLMHVLIALGLLIGAIRLFVAVQGVKQKPWNWVGISGLGSIIVALGGGVLTITGPWNEVFAFIMGLGYIGAVTAYVFGLISLPTKSK